MVSVVGNFYRAQGSIGFFSRAVYPNLLKQQSSVSSRWCNTQRTAPHGDRLRTSFGIHGVGKSVSTRKEKPTEKRFTKKHVYQFGEDAAFVCGPVIGVADGVGGWKKYDVDPSVFPRALLEHCFNVISHGGPPIHSNDDSEPLLLKTLESAYEAIQTAPDRSSLVGGSTATLVHIDSASRVLEGLNLGDSGWRVFRGDGPAVATSSDMRHNIMSPMALSCIPDDWDEIRFVNDMPADAEFQQVALHPGDIVVVASDGLFDNLHEDAISRTLHTLLRDPRVDADHIAAVLVREAVQVMKSKDYLSPYAERLSDDGHFCLGGKPDDISVCVAVVE